MGIILSWSDAGRCLGGACQYDAHWTPCDEPPASQCDGDELRQWNGRGSCTLGICEYLSEVIPCDMPP
ncbi:MAG: hypothetical protein ACNA8W_24390, partial [Bradymonadaceae bacterium]